MDSALKTLAQVGSVCTPILSILRRNLLIEELINKFTG